MRPFFIPPITAKAFSSILKIYLIPFNTEFKKFLGLLELLELGIMFHLNKTSQSIADVCNIHIERTTLVYLSNQTQLWRNLKLSPEFDITLIEYKRIPT